MSFDNLSIVHHLTYQQNLTVYPHTFCLENLTKTCTCKARGSQQPDCVKVCAPEFVGVDEAHVSMFRIIVSSNAFGYCTDRRNRTDS